MKVLMAQDTFLPRLGGAEVHVWKLSKALVERGHDVAIATGEAGPDLVDGLRVHRFPGLRGRTSFRVLPVYLPRLAHLVAGSQVVHGHYSALYSAILGTLARLLRRPFVVSLHGFGTLDSSVEGSAWRRLWRVTSLRSAHRVIATSDELASVARRYKAAACVLCIPNGVDTQEFFPVSGPAALGPLRIGAVRRLVPKNGVQYLIEAVPLIMQRAARPVEFWIVGDGPLRRSLEEQVRRAGVADAVRFLGAIPNSDVPGVLQRMDLLVFPSSAEATSIAALEAMSMEKPLVASDVGAYPTLITESGGGLLVPLFGRTQSRYDAPPTLEAKRMEALVDAVVRLIRCPDLARALGRRGRDYVRRKHDWRVIARDVEHVYQEAIGRCA